MSSLGTVNIAIVGAGPAGVFTAETITQQFAEREIPVRVDVFERLPVPFGLVRYGIAPDHPRIRSIVESLHNVLGRGEMRLVAGIAVGADLDIADLREAYDAVVLSTGAHGDAPLPIPGVELKGSFGASELISWYVAHPGAPQCWELDAEQVAVIGGGNVALDITRMLSTNAEDLLTSDIPGPVYKGLRDSKITDVHIFARRGPAEVQFSPDELRGLDAVPNVDIVVDPDDLIFDRSSEELMKSFKQRRMVAATLLEWSKRDLSSFTAPRRIHLHFMQAPVRIEGTSQVEGITVERTRHLGNGTVEGTGEYHRYKVGQVYRAVGFASSPVPGVPFDPTKRTVPHFKGRILDEDGNPILGLYASGWIKRGPVGLIGSIRSDSLQTVMQLLEDIPQLAGKQSTDPLPALVAKLPAEKIGWDGWLRVNDYEQALGMERGRERVKVYGRDQLLAIARGQAVAE